MCGSGGLNASDLGNAVEGVGKFARDVLPIAAWVAQPFMLGAGSGAEAGAGWVSAEGGAGYAGGMAADAAAAGGTAAVADGGGVGTAYGDGGASETIPPLQDAGTGQVATDAGAAPPAGGGTTSPDYLKKAKDAASLVGAAAGIAKALAPTPEPPTAPAPPPPPAQSAQSADISAILKKNSLLFGADSPASTDLTRGGAGMGNLGKVSLLGGTSKLGK